MSFMKFFNVLVQVRFLVLASRLTVMSPVGADAAEMFKIFFRTFINPSSSSLKSRILTFKLQMFVAVFTLLCFNFIAFIILCILFYLLRMDWQQK